MLHVLLAAHFALTPPAAKPAWKWTIDERVSARFDPSRKSRYIDGRREPHLFVPLELIDDIIVQPHDVTAFDASIRDPYKTAISNAGWNYRRFWRAVETSSAQYVRTMNAVAFFAQREPQSPKLAQLSHLLCSQRIGVLNDMRKELGEEAFDRFLYTAVATRRGVTMAEQITADSFRKFANGHCD